VEQTIFLRLGYRSQRCPLRQIDAVLISMQRAAQNVTPHVGASLHLLALALYTIISIFFLGRMLWHGFTAYHLGPAVDSSFLMWALAWWPYALCHGLNPFICRLIWVPSGFNLAWSGGIPLPSLIAAPLTITAGPVATYNVLCLCAPALAAWCVFILCYRLTGAFYPALVGGYLFGYSPYMLGHLVGGHLNLLLLFPAPLIVMAVLAGLQRTISPSSLILVLVLTFIAQFLCSIELAATTVIFGGVALLAGWWLSEEADQARWWALIKRLALAGLISIVILSPYLYYLFQPGAPHGAINSPGGYSTDLLNLLIPTRTAALGLVPDFETLASRFPGNIGEKSAYLGLPLLLVITHFGWTRWTEPKTRLLLVLFVIIVVCALGPRLRVAGWTGFGMPWKLLMHFPLIKSALPSRFMGYAFLVTAIIASLWLADRAIARSIRIALGGLILAASLPNLDARTWAAPTNVPAFFATDSFRQYLKPGETVVLLPYGIDGDSMLWQAVAGMSFRMAGGYTGITPREYERWPVVRAFMTGTYIPNITTQLLAMMAVHGADAVIVDDAHQGLWAPLLTCIDPVPISTGGVWVYRVNTAWLTQYRDASPITWERRDAEDRFAAELAAARAYLNAGHDPAALSPLRAEQLGFLPPHWVKDRDVRTNNGLYLGLWPGGVVAVGVVGSYEALQPLIAKYQSYAAKVYFPYPKELLGPPSGDTFLRLLVMVFDPKTLLNNLPIATVGLTTLSLIAGRPLCDDLCANCFPR
jgi:hypothetical protein